MAQQLIVLAALPEDPSLVSSTHIKWLSIGYKLQVQGDGCTLLVSMGTCTHVHPDTHVLIIKQYLFLKILQGQILCHSYPLKFYNSEESSIPCDLWQETVTQLRFTSFRKHFPSKETNYLWGMVGNSCKRSTRSGIQCQVWLQRIFFSFVWLIYHSFPKLFGGGGEMFFETGFSV